VERTALNQLEQWKLSRRRKPLLLQGQRQVGKTWLLNEFGRTSYQDLAYFNFEENPALGQIFETSKDPKRIIEQLSAVRGAPIRPGSTLLVLDEIQESNQALNSLKYFAEDTPECHVACAGSLLGVRLSGPGSFPVGKVDFLTIHPMTFSEFLMACGDTAPLEYMNGVSVIAPIPDAIGQPLTERLRSYMIVGGMPEAVDVWSNEKDPAAVGAVQQGILNSYELDFSKHAPARDIARIGYVWRSIPSQLARDNKKFLYKAAREGSRARDYEDALNWLVATGVVTRVDRSTAPKVPLPAYDDLSAFKLYAADTGLLARQSGLDFSVLSDPAAPFVEFKGALAENVVLQSLVSHFDVPPRYWTSSGEAEIEFLLQRGGDVHPIEVKSGRSVRSKSLSVYRSSFGPRLAVRLSLGNLELRDGLLNVPLYMVDQLDRLIGAALH
jgi:predicted AAA+ superfamily ATPase